MTRVKGGSIARKRRHKFLKAAKGFFGSKHRLFKTAKEQWMKSRVYAYRDRKQKKRLFRKLWITRINAACRENNISYSKFINGLTKAGLLINRKMLAEIAIDSPKAFTDLVVIASTNLNGELVIDKKVNQQEDVKKEKVKEIVKKEVKPKVKKEKVKETVKKEVKPKVKKEIKNTEKKKK